MLGQIVRRAHKLGARVSQEEVESFLVQGWPMRETADHPHHAIYFNLAQVYVRRFAHVYVPQPKARVHRELRLESGAARMAFRLDLIAHYVTDDNTPVAITFRPESLAAQQRPQGLLWSGLSPAQRVPLVVLKQQAPQLRPYVFSAEDGTLYPYQWSRKPAVLAQEAERITTHLAALTQGVFATTLHEWDCDRCPVRISCPYWIGALEDHALQPPATDEAC